MYINVGGVEAGIVLSSFDEVEWIKNFEFDSNSTFFRAH
jgi:hypothetical protein